MTDFFCDRRLIGRPFNDPIVKKDIESWPFKVVEQGANPLVQVEYLGETKTFSPQEISAMVLTKVSSHILCICIRGDMFIPILTHYLPIDEGDCRSQARQEG